jgi:hypothetical protein
MEYPQVLLVLLKCLSSLSSDSSASQKPSLIVQLCLPQLLGSPLGVVSCYFFLPTQAVVYLPSQGRLVVGTQHSALVGLKLTINCQSSVDGLCSPLSSSL